MCLADIYLTTTYVIMGRYSKVSSGLRIEAFKSNLKTQCFPFSIIWIACTQAVSVKLYVFLFSGMMNNWDNKNRIIPWFVYIISCHHIQLYEWYVDIRGHFASRSYDTHIVIVILSLGIVWVHFLNVISPRWPRRKMYTWVILIWKGKEEFEVMFHCMKFS